MVTGFSRTQIALHWAVALLILYQLLFGDAMAEVWRSYRRTGDGTLTNGALLHIIAGSLVLVFALWRLTLRFTRGVPAAPAGESRLMGAAGHAGHYALYVVMLAMPVTGLLAWFGGVMALGSVHGGILKLLLWVMIVLHFAAALYHQVVRRDGLIWRMVRAG